MLIGGKSSDFTDEVPDEFVVGSDLALAGTLLGLEGVDGGLDLASIQYTVIPLSNVMVHRASTNFCNLSGYLSPPTRLPPITGSQLLC